MNSILKEFFHGNLSPANQQMVRGSELAHIVNELTNAETLLEHALTPELLPALKHLTDVQTALNALTAEVYYIDGFKTGARFIMDIQDDACENLEPVKA